MTNNEKAMIFAASTLAALLVVVALFWRVGPAQEADAETSPAPVEEEAPSVAADSEASPPAEQTPPNETSPPEPLPVEEVRVEEEGIFPEEQQVPQELVGPVKTDEPFYEQNQKEVTLFFQSPFGEELMPEERFIFETDSVSDQIRQTVRELIRGPATELLPTIPPGTELREIYLAANGTAYVDFSQAFVDAHPGGSAAEIETVFSLVDTITFNFSQVRRVKILVEGEERSTLKDHLDLSRSFVPDMSIVTPMEL